ncbi:MAG TPA: hypothetical protein VGK46_10090, partial [Saprospiraceae bacterium]
MKITLWLFLITLIGCGTRTEVLNQNDFSEKSFITLNFTDQQEFKLDSVNISSFCFSPLEVNHIWAFCNYDGTYDLNLETGLWKKIEEPLGSLIHWVKPNDIYKDSINQDLFWMNRNGLGLGLYNKLSGKSRVFSEVNYVSSILFDTSDIWFGTHLGVFRYNRDNDRMQVVENT